MAAYSPDLNAFLLGRDEIENAGMSVEQFLSDAAKRREFAMKFDETLAHELQHAVQARRSPFQSGQFSLNLENEYEGFIAAHFYTHARLKADPKAEMDFARFAMYLGHLEDLDGWLRYIDSLYPDNVRLNDPARNATLARLRADWPAHAVEGYVLAAKRNLPERPKVARMYLQKALDMAAKHGLSAPVLEIPAPSAVPAK